MKALCIVFALLATQAHAAGPGLGGGTGPYSAQATVQRAQVGTHSPRLAPPVRVTVERDSARFRTSGQRKPAIQQEFERMDCRWQSSTDSIVCTSPRAEEVNPYKNPR